MKVKGNKCTLSQIKWLEWLNKQGYKCKVAYGADECIETIKEYLGIK